MNVKFFAQIRFVFESSKPCKSSNSFHRPKTAKYYSSPLQWHVIII